MKKQFLLLAFVMLGFTSAAFAQYAKGDVVINGGLSLGLIGYNWNLYAHSSGFLPVTASVEYSLDNRFSVGPYLGYYGKSYKYMDGYKDKFTALAFGARGTFHASSFLNEHLNWNINEAKWDLYGSLMLGIETYRWKVDGEYQGVNYYSNSTEIDLAPVLGARYYISPAFGTFLELGRGSFGYFTLGASARL